MDSPLRPDRRESDATLTDDWLKFFDYAAVDSGRIPDYVLKDEELVEKLPAFFRTLSGNKPSDEELENLIKLLRER
jgi:hypothetical protein